MEGQDSDESRSLSNRARDAARRVTGPLASATRAVMGKDVEQQVAEYTETLTQVALGLHEDLEIASRRIGNLEATIAELQNSPGVVDPGLVDPQGAHKNSAPVVSIAALAVALVALGVSVWIAL